MAKQQGHILEKERIDIKEPDMYKVIMHNDDFTTMGFVVEVLVTVFYKSEAEAVGLMLSIHAGGSATVGIYPLDIALSKTRKAQKYAKDQGYPLRITVEKD